MILIICFILFNIIITENILKGVFYICSSMDEDYKFIENVSTVNIKPLGIRDDLNKYYFRIKHLNNSFYIESISSNKRLILDDKNNLKLIEKNNTRNNNMSWNITKIKNDEYSIQNKETRNYLFFENYNIKCSKDISNIFKINISIYNQMYNNISLSYSFKFIKLYEEPEISEEIMKYIEEEPVDVVIKYIDLSDKTLNRAGIHQIKKDEDHEELRYCIRSIFENIPWFRKIIIVMPNNKVKYFKSPEKIKEKIVYIKSNIINLQKK